MNLKKAITVVLAILIFSLGSFAQENDSKTASPTQENFLTKEKLNGLSKKLDSLSSNVTKLSQKLETSSDNNLENKITDLTNEIGALRITNSDGKQTFYDSQINWLNIFIGVFTVVLTIGAICFAALGVFGFKSIHDINANIVKEVKARYEDIVREIYTKEFESFRQEVKEEIIDIAKKVDALGLELRQKNDGTLSIAPSTSNNPENKNAFDE